MPLLWSGTSFSTGIVVWCDGNRCVDLCNGGRLYPKWDVGGAACAEAGRRLSAAGEPGIWTEHINDGENQYLTTENGNDVLNDEGEKTWLIKKSHCRMQAEDRGSSSARLNLNAKWMCRSEEVRGQGLVLTHNYSSKASAQQSKGEQICDNKEQIALTHEMKELINDKWYMEKP